MKMHQYSDIAASTAIYPDAGRGTINALAYLGLGLGEAGEIQGKIKKVLRDAAGLIGPQATEDILHELGDLLWYIDRLAHELGSDLDTVANANLDKLLDRQLRGVLGGSGDHR